VSSVYFSGHRAKAPYGTTPACAKRATYPERPPVVPDPESLAPGGLSIQGGNNCVFPTRNHPECPGKLFFLKQKIREIFFKNKNAKSVTPDFCPGEKVQVRIHPGMPGIPGNAFVKRAFRRSRPQSARQSVAALQGETSRSVPALWHLVGETTLVVVYSELLHISEDSAGAAATPAAPSQATRGVVGDRTAVEKVMVVQRSKKGTTGLWMSTAGVAPRFSFGACTHFTLPGPTRGFRATGSNYASSPLLLLASRSRAQRTPCLEF